MPNARNISIREAFKHDQGVMFPLARAGYKTLGDLTKKTAQELMDDIRLIGPSRIATIRLVLKANGGLKLKGD